MSAANSEQSIFLAALELATPAERLAFLKGACGEDAVLLASVQALLAAHDKSMNFLDQPPLPTSAYHPLTEAPETIIGQYKLLQQIGEGGFGVVYMAEQEQPVRRKVALKIIKPGMDTREVIARFESERQALALMDHPNIARVFDAGTVGVPPSGGLALSNEDRLKPGLQQGRPYFVMELVKGIPITEFCDKNHLPTDKRLDLFISVCHAVQHAHHKGIIHRDIKPSNVMVTLHDGVPVVKVIDFGVAKATAQKLTERTLFTAYGQMIGTPVYMSPEQAEMSGLDIDTRSDIYSLGVLLYELLTGTTPLEAQRLRQAGYAEMQRLIREEEPPPPSTRLSSLGGVATVLADNRGTDARRLAQLLRRDLDWIVMKALDKDRTRRYETASAFAQDLRRFLSEEPVEARSPSPAYRLRKFVRRNRMTVFLSSFVVMTVVAILVNHVIGLYRVRRERDRAIVAEQLAADRLLVVEEERDRASKAWTEAETNARLLKVAVAQEDSRRLAAHSMAVRSANPGRALLLAIAAADRSPGRLASHNNALLAALRDCQEERTSFAPPFKTPKGRTGRTAFVALKTTPDGSRAVAVGVRSNDPGSQYYFDRGMTDSAYVYDLRTGQVLATMKLPGLWFSTMAISPDSSLLAAGTDHSVVVRYANGKTVAFTDRVVRLWDLRTGKEVRLFKGHTDRVVSIAFDAQGDRLVTASWDRTARIWDVGTGKTIHVLNDGKKSLDYANFSPDGQRVLTVPTRWPTRGHDTDQLQKRWFPEKVHPDQILLDPPAPTDEAIRWIEPVTGTSSGGSTVISSPQLWDAMTGKRLAELQMGKPMATSEEEHVAEFTPDGTHVATANRNTIRLWNARTGNHTANSERPRDSSSFLIKEMASPLRVAIHTLADSSQSIMLLWQADKNRQGWRRTRAASRMTRGYGWEREGGIDCLDASLDGPPLLARPEGDIVTVRDASSGSEIAVLRGHDDKVSSAAFLPGGQRIVTAAHDGTVRLWNLAPHHDPIGHIRGKEGPLGHAVFVSGGKQILSTARRDEFGRFAGKSLTVWNATTRALVRELADKESLATSPLLKQLPSDLVDFDLSPDGARLVTVHQDYNPSVDPKAEPQPSPLYTPVRVWDFRTGKRLFVLEGLKRSVATARFSPDGRRLLTFSDGNHRYARVDHKGQIHGSGSGGQLWARVDIWDGRTGQHLRNIVPEKPGGGNFALWSPDGKRVLTNAHYHIHKVAADLFDADSGKRLAQLKYTDGGIDQAAFSPDGKLVLGYRRLILHEQHHVLVWDASTGAQRFTLRGHTGNVTSSQFSPDSRSILSTSTDGTARLWDSATGEPRRVLRGHQNVLPMGRFSPDGKWIATASTDGASRIWSAETGQTWLTLPVTRGEVLGVDFSPDNERIVTSTTDGVVNVWPIDPLPLARSRKPRDLTAEERDRFQIASTK